MMDSDSMGKWEEVRYDVPSAFFGSIQYRMPWSGSWIAWGRLGLAAVGSSVRRWQQACLATEGAEPEQLVRGGMESGSGVTDVFVEVCDT